MSITQRPYNKDITVILPTGRLLRPVLNSSVTFDDLRCLVGGPVQVVRHHEGFVWLGDEEGRLKDSQFNDCASTQAGIGLVGTIVRMTLEDWERIANA